MLLRPGYDKNAPPGIRTHTSHTHTQHRVEHTVSRCQGTLSVPLKPCPTQLMLFSAGLFPSCGRSHTDLQVLQQYRSETQKTSTQHLCTKPLVPGLLSNLAQPITYMSGPLFTNLKALSPAFPRTMSMAQHSSDTLNSPVVLPKVLSTSILSQGTLKVLSGYSPGTLQRYPVHSYSTLTAYFQGTFQVLSKGTLKVYGTLIWYSPGSLTSYTLRVLSRCSHEVLSKGTLQVYGTLVWYSQGTLTSYSQGTLKVLSRCPKVPSRSRCYLVSRCENF